MSPPYEVTSRRNHTGKFWGKFLDEQNPALARADYSQFTGFALLTSLGTHLLIRRRKAARVMLCGYHPCGRGAASTEGEMLPILSPGQQQKLLSTPMKGCAFEL